MKRDEVIKQVAQAVGPNHSVDLKNYDCLILVEIYRNVLGMSVVSGDYERLKRFNLAEIYDPTPRPPNGGIEQLKAETLRDTADKDNIVESTDLGEVTTESSTAKAGDADADASGNFRPDAST